jgi:putative ABC transport system permease protein
MPESFQFPTRQAEIWAPLTIDPGRVDRGEIGTAMIGRLRPGKTLVQAETELAARMRALRQEHAGTYVGWDADVIPLRDWHIGANQRKTLWLLLAAVAIVLLVSCANVANMLLAWGSARRDEIAVRLTLGSSRARIISQLLTECVLLGLGGAALGLAFSIWAREAFVNLLPPASPFQLMPIETDWRVVSYALGVAMVSVLAAGLAPVRHALRIGLVSAHGERVAPTRLRATLLVAQTAATVLLLAGAGLLVRSFLNVWSLDPGFSRTNVQTTRIGLPGSMPASRRIAFFDDLLGRLASAPGARAVGGISNLPLGGENSSNYISIEGRPELHTETSHPGAERLSVTPGVLRALQIPLLDGRTFTAADTATAPLVVIVNRTLAARFYPNESPVGKRIKRGTPQAPFPWMTIVGVVGDIKISGLLGDVGPTIFLAHTQTPTPAMTIVLRTDAPIAAVTEQVRSTVRALDPNQPVGAIRPFDDIVFDSLATRTFPMLWIACFAGLAVMLSALGVHGVVSYALAQRRREFGIRLALGASQRRLLSQALRQSLLPTALGCAFGLAAALWLTSALSSLVFGIGLRDQAWLFAAAALFPVIVALVSSYPSARRVTSLDPTMVLRMD